MCVLIFHIRNKLKRLDLNSALLSLYRLLETSTHVLDYYQLFIIYQYIHCIILQNKRWMAWIDIVLHWSKLLKQGVQEHGGGGEFNRFNPVMRFIDYYQIILTSQTNNTCVNLIDTNITFKTLFIFSIQWREILDHFRTHSDLAISYFFF